MATDSDKPIIKYKELSLKRSSIKGQITKFKNYLTTLESIQLSSTSLAELSLKLNKFETLSTKFEDLQTEMEVLNYQNLDSEINERDGIENEIISCIATAKILIENAKIQSEARRKSLAPATSCHHHHDPDSLGFKLPQIQIAKFDGAYFRWLEFRDTFQSVVHENEHLSEIHKYHYLISYLEGDAARVIANLEVSSSNYKEAWSLLCERYDNKRLLINYHLTELFNIQPIATESERSLRYLVDHVTKNLRALASLGQPTDKWDVLVIFMLTSKLHSNTLMRWEELRNSLNEVPTLEQFNKFLTNRADVLEALNRGKSDNNNKPQKTMHISNHSTPSKNTYTQNSHHKNQYHPPV